MTRIKIGIGPSAYGIRTATSPNQVAWHEFLDNADRGRGFPDTIRIVHKRSVPVTRQDDSLRRVQLLPVHARADNTSEPFSYLATNSSSASLTIKVSTALAGLVGGGAPRGSWQNGLVPKDYFGERIAEGYDAKWAELFEPAVVDPTVSFLADLAGTGAALELGIGTGRIALPLSRRGVSVHGIELSPAMVAQLRAKPGTDKVAVTVGDFATTRVDGSFKLAYLVRNTITNLTTQDEQVECFRNVAAHLEPGGYFVIEVYIPELQRLPPGETIHAFTVTPTHLGFEEYDVATQIAFSHHYWVVDGQLETFSAPFRYVWPSELDLMARLAGMTLRERWSGWKREPFTSDSRNHVSVWEKAG